MSKIMVVLGMSSALVLGGLTPAQANVTLSSKATASQAATTRTKFPFSHQDDMDHLTYDTDPFVAEKGTVHFNVSAIVHAPKGEVVDGTVSLMHKGKAVKSVSLTDGSAEEIWPVTKAGYRLRVTVTPTPDQDSRATSWFTSGNVVYDKKK